MYHGSTSAISKEEHGLEGLREKSPRKLCIENRIAPEIEDAFLNMAYEYPAYGQARASNELRKDEILVSGVLLIGAMEPPGGRRFLSDVELPRFRG